MSRLKQLEREEDLLAQQLEDGIISQKEYQVEMRNLHRDYRETAEESAQKAHDRELEEW